MQSLGVRAKVAKYAYDIFLSIGTSIQFLKFPNLILVKESEPHWLKTKDKFSNGDQPKASKSDLVIGLCQNFIPEHQGF